MSVQWTRVLVDYIDVIFSHPRCFVIGFIAIVSAFVAPVLSGSLKMYSVNLSLRFILFYEFCHIYIYIYHNLLLY